MIEQSAREAAGRSTRCRHCRNRSGIDRIGSAEATTTPAAGEGLIAIITPAHDNPFFKAEADAAQAEAEESRLQDERLDPRRRREQAERADRHGHHTKTPRRSSSTTPEPMPRWPRSRRPRTRASRSFLIDREINATGIATAQIISNNAQGMSAVAEEFATADRRGGNLHRADRQGDGHQRRRSLGGRSTSVLDQYPDIERGRPGDRQLEPGRGLHQGRDAAPAAPRRQGHHRRQRHDGARRRAAVEAAGLLDQITIAGFDGSPDAVQAIKDGKLIATGLQPAVLIAELAVQQARRTDHHRRARRAREAVDRLHPHHG